MSLIYGIIVRRRIGNYQRRKLIIIRRQLRDTQNPFEECTEQQFIDLYRFPKSLCVEFLEKIKPRFFVNERRSAIPVHLKFLCAVGFYAAGSFQRTIGQDFLTSMSQTSVNRCIHEVSDILNEISREYVYFPDDEEQIEIKAKFYEISSFPGIMGLIDGTHIKIIAPSSDVEQAYYCRKGGHSINVLLVCDSNNLIRYANAKFPGTSHDAYIWRRSALLDHFKRKYEAGMRNFWLLGDSGFPQQPWLMTPYNSPSSRAQENYNISHKSTRCQVERCIGILKSRFRCISSGNLLNYNPTKAGKIINSCIVLHNVLQKSNVEVPGDIILETSELQDLSSVNLESSLELLRGGQRVRQSITQTYFC